MEQPTTHIADILIGRTVENYSARLTRDYELASQLRASALSRLVWLTGISGFVILNVKPYLDSIRGTTVGGTQLLWLYIPWILTAVLAILSHFAIDEWTAKENVFYSNKKDAIDLHRIGISQGKPDADQFSALIRDLDPEIKSLRNDADKLFHVAKWLERSTFGMLIIAFIFMGIAVVLR